jgi:hypothetical protein
MYLGRDTFNLTENIIEHYPAKAFGVLYAIQSRRPVNGRGKSSFKQVDNSNEALRFGSPISGSGGHIVSGRKQAIFNTTSFKLVVIVAAIVKPKTIIIVASIIRLKTIIIVADCNLQS